MGGSRKCPGKERQVLSEFNTGRRSHEKTAANHHAGRRRRRAGAASASAETKVQLVEVITSPQRTEFLKQAAGRIRESQSRHQGRDRVAALGPGLREIPQHGAGRRDARCRRDAGAMDGPLCQQRPARGSWPLHEGLAGTRNARRSRQAVRLDRQEHAIHDPLRLLRPRDVLEQEALRRSGTLRATADDR